MSFEFEGIDFKYPVIDLYKCDMAKRYCLSGEEGPKYYGINPEINISENIDIEKIARNISKVKWGVQKRHLNICEECIRVCPFKGRRE